MNEEQHQKNKSIANNSFSYDFKMIFEVIKFEYEQLAESYRHTYQTIWQAGSVFMAISAALLALAGLNSNNHYDEFSVLNWLWPLPFFFWWLGIFTPMDRYGKLRLQRLKELEVIINKYLIQNKYSFSHFTYMENRLEKLQKLLSFRFLRVGITVDIFGIIILLVWLYNNIFVL